VASRFAPTASRAFYINTQGGVGINTDNPQVIFDSYGAVQLWVISGIDTMGCSENNIGLMGTKRVDGKLYLCACTNKGYWTSVLDDPDGSKTEACTNERCKYDPRTKKFTGDEC